jgi:uncharacterized protein YndB with AHSA1/START domain
MTPPDEDVPRARSIDLEMEVPGTPEQVWEAIATGPGISAWMHPTEVEGREGGTFSFDMGSGMTGSGTVTGWEPPQRFVQEDEWRPGGEAPPARLATEWLVEARSGGTCVVRVTASAFGTGADWENEFIAEMETYFRPFFDLLRLYVERFPGQHATRREVRVDLSNGVAPADVVPAAARSLRVAGPGETVDEAGALGLSGTVLRVESPYLMVEADEPVPGYVSLVGMPCDGGGATVELDAWLFGPDAPAFADKAEDGWRAWLAGLGR